MSRTLDVVFGRTTLTIATLSLTIAGVWNPEKRSWLWIFCSAGFILAHTAVSEYRERSIVRALGRDYDRIQRKCVQAVADLGELVGGRFDIWMVDLYLPRKMWRLSPKWPFIKLGRVLSRELSMSLVDPREQPPSIALDDLLPHGKCFQSTRRLLWLRRDSYEQDGENAGSNFSVELNDKLSKDYGALSLNPLVDSVGKHCVGVLAVHVAPDRDSAFKAKSALRSGSGQRKLANICEEINGLLRRRR